MIPKYFRSRQVLKARELNLLVDAINDLQQRIEAVAQSTEIPTAPTMWIRLVVEGDECEEFNWVQVRRNSDNTGWETMLGGLSSYEVEGLNNTTRKAREKNGLTGFYDGTIEQCTPVIDSEGIVQYMFEDPDSPRRECGSSSSILSSAGSDESGQSGVSSGGSAAPCPAGTVRRSVVISVDWDAEGCELTVVEEDHCVTLADV